MVLHLPPHRQRRIERGFNVAVIVAALLTMPLTYAHMQEWSGWWLVAADWIIWAVFGAEFAFHMAASSGRWHTLRQQWFTLAIVVVSVPLLPYLLSLTRLFRLLRPLRLIRGLRIARPVQLIRLYALRAAGSRRVMEHAMDEGTRKRARKKVRSAVPGADERDR